MCKLKWLRRCLCSLVALHVSLQAVALSEGLLAQGTLVRSLSVVRPHVDGEVSSPGTRFPTDPTDVWFGSCVDRHVVVQVSLPFEGPAAVRTAVRCLPGVDPHVDGQRPPGGETLPAAVAAVRLLVGVRPHVDDKLLAGQEHLAADVAEVRSLSVHVNLLVLLQSGGQLEAPLTDLASVGSFSRVRHLVAGQRSVAAQEFAADATEVRFTLPVHPVMSL